MRVTRVTGVMHTRVMRVIDENSTVLQGLWGVMGVINVKEQVLQGLQGIINICKHLHT